MAARHWVCCVMIHEGKRAVRVREKWRARGTGDSFSRLLNSLSHTALTARACSSGMRCLHSSHPAFPTLTFPPRLLPPFRLSLGPSHHLPSPCHHPASHPRFPTNPPHPTPSRLSAFYSALNSTDTVCHVPSLLFSSTDLLAPAHFFSPIAHVFPSGIPYLPAAYLAQLVRRAKRTTGRAATGQQKGQQSSGATSCPSPLIPSCPTRPSHHMLHPSSCSFRPPSSILHPVPLRPLPKLSSIHRVVPP